MPTSVRTFCANGSPLIITLPGGPGQRVDDVDHHPRPPLIVVRHRQPLRLLKEIAAEVERHRDLELGLQIGREHVEQARQRARSRSRPTTVSTSSIVTLSVRRAATRAEAPAAAPRRARCRRESSSATARAGRRRRSNSVASDRRRRQRRVRPQVPKSLAEIPERIHGASRSPTMTREASGSSVNARGRQRQPGGLKRRVPRALRRAIRRDAATEWPSCRTLSRHGGQRFQDHAATWPARWRRRRRA